MTDNIDPQQLDPVPSGLPEDTEYLGSKMDRMIALLGDIEQKTVRQETPAPGFYFAMVNHNDFPQAVRTRLTWFVVSVSKACVITVRIGTAAFISYETGAADTLSVPFATSIDGGKDVVVTATLDAVIDTAVFLGYPESDRPV